MSIASIVRNGVNLRCRITGTANSAGQALLLIHGLNTNMAFWHPWLVRQLGLRHRVLLYDQRGHGYSDIPPSGYTSLELAEDARAILDDQDISSVHLVAHSFGAGVALQLARLDPGRIASLTLLDGRIRSIQPEVRLRDWVHFPRWERKFADAGIVVDPEWQVDCTLPMRLLTADVARIADALEEDGFFVPKVQGRAAAKYWQLMTETSALADFQDPAGLTHEALRELNLPTLLVYGRLSPFFPTGEELANEMHGARFEILEGAGHNFPLNQPQRTWNALASWDALDLHGSENDMQETRQPVPV